MRAVRVEGYEGLLHGPLLHGPLGSQAAAMGHACHLTGHDEIQLVADSSRSYSNSAVVEALPVEVLGVLEDPGRRQPTKSGASSTHTDKKWVRWGRVMSYAGRRVIGYPI